MNNIICIYNLHSGLVGFIVVHVCFRLCSDSGHFRHYIYSVPIRWVPTEVLTVIQYTIISDFCSYTYIEKALVGALSEHSLCITVSITLLVSCVGDLVCNVTSKPVVQAVSMVVRAAASAGASLLAALSAPGSQLRPSQFQISHNGLRCSREISA